MFRVKRQAEMTLKAKRTLVVGHSLDISCVASLGRAEQAIHCGFSANFCIREVVPFGIEAFVLDA
jgi:hypothetical protein